jgi:TRAP-type C4-dicarboxylate transport system substrate-binding protein
MNQTMRSIAVAIAGCAAVLSACTETESTLLKVHHFVPPSSTIHREMVVPWCEEIEQASAGELKCQIFPSMQLGGSPTQLYDQVKDGVADVVFAVPGFSAGRFPSVEVFELPFMMKDAGATSKALWDYVARDDVMDFADVKPIFLNVHGPGLFHMVSKPVMSRADLSGMKVRAPTRQSSNLIAELGGIPVGMPLPQVPEALSKGVIDGVVVPYEIVPAIKVNELTEFHSEPDTSQAAIYTTVFLFAMNSARYESLSPSQKKVIDAHSGVELSGRIGKIMSDADTVGRESVPTDSINVIPAAEVKEWVALSEPVIDRWVEEMNERGADGNALLESARRLTEKYSQQ